MGTKRRSPAEAARARIHLAAHSRRIRTIDVLEGTVFVNQLFRVARKLGKWEDNRRDRITPVNESMEELDLQEYRR
jgi:hypothetical protein